ncbi:MAG: hypothetical protein QXF15_03610 [Candidatus Aenigmatarchaeota archaeon]
MKKIKKMEKIGLIIAGIIGIGEIAYFFNKFQQQQPPSQQPPTTQPPEQQPQPPTPPQPQPIDLEIQNYTLSFDWTTHSIIAKGTVIFQGQPRPNAMVMVGFCSLYPSAYTNTYTDANGNFQVSIYTSTPSGGQNCIYAETSIANKKVLKTATITIPYGSR